MVEEFNANITKMMDEAKQNITALITKLPTVLSKRLEILNNEDQTIVQQNQALADLNAQEPEAYRVIQYVFDMLMPCGCGAGGPGGRGGGGGPGGRRGSRRDGWNPRFAPNGYGGPQGMNQFGPPMTGRDRGWYDSDEWYDGRRSRGYRGGPYGDSEEIFFNFN
ncbi:hypothetical protein TELCIR_17807 [Teladorsagia circumcincta]|uniref:SXP/RAL-2 family protein Ani s 5-like cation-binding domain-containing protein n=1 Tax=Teladorsagia circumcincta TaxID=45464 RepID=A0A2G9TRS1_TELCI|nr:hypothetical protein TELCIR_17807 [Teladorsagia circumcincta]